MVPLRISLILQQCAVGIRAWGCMATCMATCCLDVQDAMMLDEPGHMLDMMDEDRTGTAMHGRPKRRR